MDFWWTFAYICRFLAPLLIILVDSIADNGATGSSLLNSL